MIAHFLTEHPDFSLVPVTTAWGIPAFDLDRIRPYCDVGACDADLTACRRILPQHGGEGHFVALLHRAEDVSSTPPRPYCPPTKDIHRTAAQELYEECFIAPPIGEFVTFGDYVRLLPPELPDLAGINVLSAGVRVAQVCKNRLEPSHSAFLATTLDNCHRALSFTLDDPRLTAFLRGEELPCDGETGWTAVGIENLTVGFGKNAGGRLKNRYPKGLRLL